MANSSENDASRWVEDCMASLMPPAKWQPDTAQGLGHFRSRREARTSRTRTGALAGLAMASICVCALAFPRTRVFAERCVEACLTETSLAGKLLSKRPPASSPMRASDARELAPDFTLRDAAGNSVTLSDFRGRVVLLNFWVTWCAPCNVEIPWFNEFQKEYGSAGLVVLGISMDDEGWRAVKAFLKEKPEGEKVKYRVMLGAGEIARRYGGVASIPTTFLIDRTGRIAEVRAGLTKRNTYEEDVRKLIAEK